MNQREEYYPALTVYSCPRFYKGSIIADGRAPLTSYINRIYANNCKQIIQEEAPEKTSIQDFVPDDGLLYKLGAMRKLRNFNSKGIKILVCVCMYNESINALERTLRGIYDNLKSLDKAGFSPDDLAVVVLQDGILKLVNDRVRRTFTNGGNSVVEFYRKLDKAEGKERCYLVERINVVLDEIDNFQRKRMGEFVTKNNDFPPSIEKNLSLVYQNLWKPEGQTSPYKLRLLTCFKHTNGTKLSSHLWFFEGFCRHINPHYCVLLDVGTKPDSTGILQLIRGFTSDEIGGVTGLMSIDQDIASEEQDEEGGGSSRSCLGNFFYNIERAQEFQYIMSHFLDKNCESALGFLHVLPGAWSAYRYDALIHGEKFEQNLLERKYFKMILDPNAEERDHREANMYLAEDRILSLGIYCQPDKSYILKYVPTAIARTDPMLDLTNLMKQRRRWINSSYFAFEYVNRNYYFNVMESAHNCFRRYVLLPLSMLLANLSFINGYFTPAFFFFTLYTTVIQAGSFTWLPYVAALLCLIYVVTVFICIGGSLIGNIWTLHATKASVVFSIYTYLLIALVAWNVVYVYIGTANLASFSDIVNNPESFLVFIMTCINVFGYFVIVLMHLPTHAEFVFKMMMDALSYLAFQGSYSHVMVIFSFCNIDDVSWGTKGVKSMGVKKYANEKVFFVANWIFWNSVAAFVFLFIDFFIPRDNTKGYVLLTLGIYSTLIMTVRIILAVYYHFEFYIPWLFAKCCHRVDDRMETRKRDLATFFGTRV